MEGTTRHLSEVTREIMDNIKEKEAEKEDQVVQTSQAGTAVAGRVAERLERLFSLGSDPEKRKKLFDRLEYEVEERGEDAYRIINDCVQSAQSARKPARWFCKSVILRLKEAGFLSAANQVEW